MEYKLSGAPRTMGYTCITITMWQANNSYSNDTSVIISRFRHVTVRYQVELPSLVGVYCEFCRSTNHWNTKQLNPLSSLPHRLPPSFFLSTDYTGNSTSLMTAPNIFVYMHTYTHIYTVSMKLLCALPPWKFDDETIICNNILVQVADTHCLFLSMSPSDTHTHVPLVLLSSSLTPPLSPLPRLLYMYTYTHTC